MNLCVIPARGGSKRIPKKNIKEFNGKPIIAYSISAAIESGCFDRVIVSTDDHGIKNVAESYGAEVPFIRPKSLSDDFTGTLPVIKHAIEWIEVDSDKPEYVCCLYATAPFMQASTIQKSFDLLKQAQSDYCFSVTQYPFPIQRAIKLTDENRVSMFYPEQFNTRSQDLVKAYHDAGQLYWGKTEAFKKMIPFFSEVATPYLLPGHLVQDIDTPEQWARAELMYKVLNLTH